MTKTFKGAVTKLVENKGRNYATVSNTGNTEVIYLGSSTDGLFSGETLKVGFKGTFEYKPNIKKDKLTWSSTTKVTKFIPSNKTEVVYGEVTGVGASKGLISELTVKGLNKGQEDKQWKLNTETTTQFSDKLAVGKRIKCSVEGSNVASKVTVYKDHSKVGTNTKLFKMVVGMLWKVAYLRVPFKEDFKATQECVVEMYSQVEELKIKLLNQYTDKDASDIGAKVGSNLELVVSSLKAKDKKDFNLILGLTEKSIIANIQLEVLVTEHLNKETSKEPAKKVKEETFEDGEDQGIVDL